MNKPKRVWNKKSPVFYKGKCVWKLGDKLGIYDPNFTEVDEWQIYPNNRWENVGSGEELQIYDSNKPTNIWTFKDGIVASYEFQDYDGTVLKSWSVKDWETPVPPTDPTREGYRFTWWSPEVGPISEDTTYVAQYIATTVTITIKSFDTWIDEMTDDITFSPATITLNIWDRYVLSTEDWWTSTWVITINWQSISFSSANEGSPYNNFCMNGDLTEAWPYSEEPGEHDRYVQSTDTEIDLAFYYTMS